MNVTRPFGFVNWCFSRRETGGSGASSSTAPTKWEQCKSYLLGWLHFKTKTVLSGRRFELQRGRERTYNCKLSTVTVLTWSYQPITWFSMDQTVNSPCLSFLRQEGGNHHPWDMVFSCQKLCWCLFTCVHACVRVYVCVCLHLCACVHVLGGAAGWTTSFVLRTCSF